MARPIRASNSYINRITVRDYAYLLWLSGELPGLAADLVQRYMTRGAVTVATASTAEYTAGYWRLWNEGAALVKVDIPRG